jgi:hypothetical protein
MSMNHRSVKSNLDFVVQEFLQGLELGGNCPVTDRFQQPRALLQCIFAGENEPRIDGKLERLSPKGLQECIHFHSARPFRCIWSADMLVSTTMRR